MNLAAIAIWALLIIGMGAFALTAVGLLVADDVFERIQFTYPAATIGVVSIVAAVVIEKALSQAGIKAMLAGFVLFWINPVLSHATARAARIRKLGQWKPTAKEHIEVVEANTK